MPGKLLADLFQAPSILALGFLDVIWGLLAAVVFFLGLLLIIIILIQDSKDGGLSGAFGGSGGGGSSLLGAGMQKGLARITATLAIVFALCVVVMGIIGNSSLDSSIGEQGAAPTPAVAPESDGSDNAGGDAAGGATGPGAGGAAPAPEGAGGPATPPGNQ